MSTDSEVRGSKLAERVEEIEKLIRSGATVTGASLASLLNSAQAQLDANRLEDEQVTNDKKEKEQKDRSAIAAMVERETKLNEEEKKKYSEFLAKDYFKRSDLSELSQFYADGGAYDRLSKNGKEQMDTRVKEGVRRGELSRDELPPEIERKTYRDETPQAKSQARERNENIQALSADDRLKAVAGQSSKVETESSKEAISESKEAPKAALPKGLDGLAALSPVQETSEVVVPQTGPNSSSRGLGG